MSTDKYPIGIQDFEKIIEGGYIYVDKTAYIRKLIEQGSIYFLGRPRRFGKSLLLSTMHAFFEGKKALFKDLDIYQWHEWEWESYPVIHIDLNAKDYTHKNSVYEKINQQLQNYEKEYCVESPDGSLDSRFAALINAAYAHTGKKVVVLIDEYDKPIIDTIHDENLKDLHRNSLRAFYSTLKSCDRHLLFCFLTGVTRFGQMGVFSGLNNLNDISLTDEFAGICGVTEFELRTYFRNGVSGCSKQWNCEEEKAFLELKKHYDGYHFSPSLVDVYNPWSLLNAISKKFIDMYWNQTGGGLSFLYHLLAAGKVMLSDLDGVSVDIQDLRGGVLETYDPVSILYQAGYLTIKSYDSSTFTFVLKYPNYEVETGFVKGLLPIYSGVGVTESRFAINGFVKDIREGDVNGFLKRMQSFFEDFPYENSLKSEKDFQNIMYCVSAMMGLQTKVERHTSRGSIDMVIETPGYVYVMEFKINRSPEVALKQIEQKGYTVPYISDKRNIVRIGIEFSTEARNIVKWRIE